MLKRLVLAACLLLIPTSVKQQITIDVRGRTSSETVRLQALANLNFTGQTMPPHWTIIVLSKIEWDSELVKRNLVGQTDTAFTVLIEDVTYINEDYVTSALNSRIRHTLAHEASHMICGCASESIANKIARQLESVEQGIG
jgi:hypothetical protein